MSEPDRRAHVLSVISPRVGRIRLPSISLSDTRENCPTVCPRLACRRGGRDSRSRRLVLSRHSAKRGVDRSRRTHPAHPLLARGARRDDRGFDFCIRQRGNRQVLGSGPHAHRRTRGVDARQRAPTTAPQSSCAARLKRIVRTRRPAPGDGIETRAEAVVPQSLSRALEELRTEELQLLTRRVEVSKPNVSNIKRQLERPGARLRFAAPVGVRSCGS